MGNRELMKIPEYEGDKGKLFFKINLSRNLTIYKKNLQTSYITLLPRNHTKENLSVRNNPTC